MTKTICTEYEEKKRKLEKGFSIKNLKGRKAYRIDAEKIVHQRIACDLDYLPIETIGFPYVMNGKSYVNLICAEDMPLERLKKKLKKYFKCQPKFIRIYYI
jgi:hypothetical protein